MADRSIVVRLRANIDDYRKKMREATSASDAAASAIDRNGDKITTSAGRMVRSAEVNREAWTTAGVALGVVATAMGAVAVSVFKTGVEYNTLQQTSRAALRTLLGGAEAANAQMDKLDEFARSSPFAKQVFIQAQQQLLGFGMEAERVIPTLGAIQDAVAAIGGSNEDIASITGVLAKIESQGKITARELMQLGIHGIDAAQLIGSQMGMTGNQIREEITAGSLDAQTALTALTDGMNERFGGAAENVKDTYAGAIDRVKAAWRDLAADLMEPLVDPDGGGMLVDLANRLADVMRWFQALPEPIKNTVAVLSGLTGLAAGVGAAFLLIFPRVMETRAAFSKLATDLPGVHSRLKGFAKGGLLIAGVMAGFALLNAGLSKLTQQTVGINEVTAALLDLADGADVAGTVIDGMVDFSAFDAFLTGGGHSLNSMADAIEELRRAGESSLFGGIQDSLIGFLNAESVFRGSLVNARESVEALDQALAGLVTSGNAGAADAAVRRFGLTSEEVGEMLPGYSDALRGVANQARLTADETEGLTEETEALATQTGLTQDELEAWRETASAATAAFIDIQGAYDAAIQKNIDLATSTADATESSEDSWEDFYDGVSVSAAEYIAQLQEQVDAQENWQNNMLAIAERVNEGMSGEMRDAANSMIDELMELGPAGAEQVALLERMTDEEFASVVELWKRRGTQAVTEFTEKVEGYRHPEVEIDASTTLATKAVNQWARTIEGRHIRVNVTARGGGAASLNQAFAGGGPIHGPGTATSDSIPIWASDGEFMHRAAAHQFWGTEHMHAVNNNDVAGVLRSLSAKGFAGGGEISRSYSGPPSVNVSHSLGDVVARMDPADIHALGDYILSASANGTSRAFTNVSRATSLAGRMA